MAQISLIAKKMLELRERLGESQEVFGERFGVQQGTVSRWEKGASIPKRTLWPVISRAAGVPAAEFFFDAVSGGLHPARLRPLLVGSYQLLGAGPSQAGLLADLVLEEAAAQSVLGPQEDSADIDKLRAGLRTRPRGGQSFS